VSLSIVVAGLERLADPSAFLERIRRAADTLPEPVEIIAALIDSRLEPSIASSGARVVVTPGAGFGSAMRTGFQHARGEFTLTVDPDFSGPPTYVSALWARRHEGEILVGSRYVPGSDARMSAGRRLGSRLLNSVFGRGLSVGVNDMSSSIRMYRTSVVTSLALGARDYDVLQEILVRAYAAGWRVCEVPIEYAPNPDVASKAHLPLVGGYLGTFWSLWRLRNSIQAADYDYRAHDSAIPLQRYWQRQRYRHITSLIEGQGPVLDVGCGSSHIISALPRGSVALDVLANKLRFARRFSVPLVRGSGFTLPFGDESFECVLCSQVIEHVPMEPSMIDELCRVLKPGGRLVLGTPDYDRWEWVVTEKLYGFFAPGGYADEHISHYTRRSLLEDFTRRGYTHEATRYIVRGELILAFRKP
jgi:SAM-dependent methyltransferase